MATTISFEGYFKRDSAVCVSHSMKAGYWGRHAIASMTARMLRRETLFDVRVIRGKEAWPNSSICNRRLSRALRVARRDIVYTGHKSDCER